MAKTTLFKGAVYLSDEQYYKLVKDGVLEVGGETILYDESMIYITPKALGGDYYNKSEIDEKLKNIITEIGYISTALDDINGEVV